MVKKNVTLYLPGEDVVVSAEEALRLFEENKISPFTLCSFEGETKQQMISILSSRLREPEKYIHFEPQDKRTEKEAIRDRPKTEENNQLDTILKPAQVSVSAGHDHSGKVFEAEREPAVSSPIKKNTVIIAGVVVFAAVILGIIISLPKEKKTPVVQSSETYYKNERQKIISVLKEWNRIKKATKRNLTTSEIYRVLTDEALEKDLGAIKWLKDNNAYWDITTNKFDITSVRFIDRNNADVLVAIYETGRYFQNGKHRESTSYYNSHYEASYRLLKKIDRWYISERPRKVRDL